MNVAPTDKFAVYLRKSRADVELERMGEGETLTRHAEMLRQLAQRQGIPAEQITEYREVVSGESIQDRPQMQALLRAVSAGVYKAVLVVEIERLARGNTSDQGKVADAFLYSNTLIITPAKTYDPRNESDQEYFEFGLFMSRREYKTIRRRLQAGKVQAVKEGQWIANYTPYGYTAVRTSRKDRHLEPVPEQMQIVRRIYNDALQGKTPYQIAKGLTLDGIPSPRTGSEWGKSTVTRILQNPVYTGKIRWAATTTTKRMEEDGSTTRRREKNQNALIVAGKHTPIVTDAEFNSIQALFKTSSPIGEGRDMVNPLSGLLRCLKCGRAIVYVSPSRKQPYPRYSHKNRVLCQQASCRAEDLMQAITEELKRQLHDAEIHAKSPKAGEQQQQKQTVTRAQAAVERQQAKLRKIYDSYEQGIYTANEFIFRRQQAQRELEQLQEQLDKCQANLAKPAPKDVVKQLHDVIDSLNNPEIPAREKNKFLKSFIRSIWYDNDGDTLNITIDMV